MPKSKNDVTKEIKNNKEMDKQHNESVKDRADKETRGKSGRFSGLGENSDKK